MELQMSPGRARSPGLISPCSARERRLTRAEIATGRGEAAATVPVSPAAVSPGREVSGDGNRLGWGPGIVAAVAERLRVGDTAAPSCRESRLRI